MKLTGQCKKGFKRWFSENSESNYRLDEWFDALEDNMKFGVYQDFFLDNGIIIDFQPVIDYNEKVYIGLIAYFITITVIGVEHKENYTEVETLEEARAESIKQANKIFNGQ